MVRLRLAVAAVGVLTLAAGCKETEWPSDADQAEFCSAITGPPFTEVGITDAIVQRGTPENLPYQARRYLIDLDRGNEPDAADKQAFDDYLAHYC